MKRMPSFLVVATLATFLVACNASTGGLGSVPTGAPTPSTGAGGPDLTPAPSTSPSTVPSDKPATTASAASSAAPSPAGTMIVRAYFVLGGDVGSAGLVPVLRVIPKTSAVAAAAMNAVLAGPTTDEFGERTISSAIPTGSRLLGITIKNGVATVDLSTEFDSGGGTASMKYRLAQVVYTLTQFSTIKSVVLQIEGQTVTVFGGEGIVLDGPQARADFYDQLPSIFVDRPAHGAALGNPGGPVVGNANVFEATFRIALLDAAGKTLLDDQVMATTGTGNRGTFDMLLGYTVSKGQWGTLRVYNPSAKDGTPEDIREYPVWLTPKS